MSRWCVAIVAYQKHPDRVRLRLCVCVVEAASKFEAEGKGMAVARRVYPVAADWEGHNVTVDDAEKVVDPATAAIVASD